ncbi:MAG TPA: major capsid protein P2 [Kaistia sp.]|jgi:hypothetical protein|nr:major capsid protein P2 [Kaistia sp.]
MGLQLFLKLPSFNAVAAGQTANLLVPRGPTYRQVLLDYRKAGTPATEAQMRTDLTKIRFKVNGVSRIDMSGSDLIDIVKYMGFVIEDGILPVFLAWPTARTATLEDALAWGTQDVDTFTIEVDIAAAAGAVTLAATAITNPVRRPLGPIMQMNTLSFASSAAGVYELSTLPRSNGDLASIHFHSSLITGLELLVDGSRYADGELSLMNAAVKWTGRVPQTGITTFEPIWLDRYEDRIPLHDKQDIRFKLTMSAAGAVRVNMLTIAAPLGIPAA